MNAPLGTWNSKNEARFEYPLPNFGSFSYFQTFFSLGVQQGLQKLPKFDINDLRHLFHCNILIPRNVRVKPYSKHSGGGPLGGYRVGWCQVSDPPRHPVTSKKLCGENAVDKTTSFWQSAIVPTTCSSLGGVSRLGAAQVDKSSILLLKDNRRTPQS